MAAPPEDECKSAEDLPAPSLNPMMNPLLGKNLGRWAHVYYTTPPEKREEAVLELLRDLEGVQKPRQETKPIAPVETNTTTAKAKTQQEALICPTCRHQSVPGQHFCGLCGSVLKTDNSHVEQISAPFSPTLLSHVERKAEDRQASRGLNKADSRMNREKGQSWKYAAFVIFVFTAMGSYWLGRMHSETPELQTARFINSRMAHPTSVSSSPAAANPERPTKESRPRAVSGASKTGIAAALSAPDLAKRPAKPSAGTPIECTGEHLEHCAVDELYRRTMTLADTVDALFIDYNKQVMRLLVDARAHENDLEQKKQERSRQGNYAAQLWEHSRLVYYMNNKRKDTLKYRMELLRRAATVGLDNKMLLNAYRNPQLCLDLHYVAQDLRRLAGKLLRLESR